MRSLFIAAFFILVNIAAFAEGTTKPTWVNNGVKYLNSQRTNDSYRFVVVNTHNTDLNRLIENRGKALSDYVVENYGAVPTGVQVDEIPGHDGMYHVDFTVADGSRHAVTAKLVDTYYELDDFLETYFEFEYYQLYALSQPDTMPVFDEFTVVPTSKDIAVRKSIIPGMGQIYKGERSKGYAILGGEIFLVGASVYFEYQRAYCKRQIDKAPVGSSSWEKKSKSWGTFRNLGIASAVVLYIYNLVDASYTNGAPEVRVGRKGGHAMMMPYIHPEGSGLTLSLTF